MERPLWSGSLAFGIVTIPIRLLAAVRDHDIHFHQISRSDRKRIRYKKVAEGSDEEVDASDIVKGYAIKPGHYVVFDDEELARIGARKSKVIDILRFVELGEIDPLFFDRPYRLVADERGAKPYQLLVETLTRSQRVGIAQLVMHGKEHLIAVRSLAGELIAHTLRFADELITPPGGSGGRRGGAAGKGHAPRVKLAEREVAMAERVVESMHERFDPADFTDEYRKRLQAAITRKARGKTLAVEEDEPEPKQGNVIDLMAALEQSLGKHQQRAGGKRPAKKAAPVRARAAARIGAAGKRRSHRRAG